MDKVQIALFGCGWFGNFHVDHLLKMEDVELAAVVSSDSQKIERMKKKVPTVRGYATAEELFATEKKLDAALICVPPACHENAELLAAQHGVHIFVEKPVGLSLKACEEIQQAIAQNGIISCVGYQGRYNPYLEELKQVLEKKTVGITLARFICSRPGVSWWSDPTLSGGQMVEQSTHLFDALRYLYGEVCEVSCYGNPDRNSECSVATLLFCSGVTAVITSGCYLDPDAVPHEVDFTVYANDLRVEFDWDHCIRYIDLKQTITKPFTQNNHFYGLRTFVEAVKTGDASKIRSDYADAVKTLKVTLAANEALKNGQPVFL